jgi:hypothetical protein
VTRNRSLSIKVELLSGRDLVLDRPVAISCSTVRPGRVTIATVT